MKKLLIGFVFVFVLASAGVYLVKTNATANKVLGEATFSFRSGTVTWTAVPNAVSYNIYYKRSTEAAYVNSVRNLSASTTSYLINYLRKNQMYLYKVAASDASGKEFSFTTPQEIPSN